MLRLFKQYYPIRNIFFILGEGVFIYASVVIAGWIVLGLDAFVHDGLLWLKALLVTFFCYACLYYNDLYDLKVTDTFKELGIRLFQSLGAAAIFLAIVYIIFPQLIMGRGIFMISTAFIIAFIVLWRLVYTAILNRGLFNHKIALVGSGTLAGNIADEILENKDCGYSVDLVVSESDRRNVFKDRIQKGYQVEKTIHRDKYEGLCMLAKSLDIQQIVVAIEEKRGAFPVRELLNCRVGGIEVMEGNSFYEMLTGKLIVGQINPSWLIFSKGFQKSWLRKVLKRIGDIFLSLVMLLLLWPLILLVAVIIKLDSKGPVFFSQDRVGQDRKNYMVHKFRSMVADAEKLSGPVWAEDDDPRITRVGNFLRKWRIDELPQLWNVLKGEMSFVGPRPEREHFVKELEQKIPYYAERFTVKPGITGWAQVSYGYGASVEDAVEKLNYDLFYIKNMSIFMDLMIVMRTVKIVLFGKGR